MAPQSTAFAVASPPADARLRAGLASGLLTGIGVAGALAAAYLLPPLAIAVVWPLLFVVPGWALVSLARPRIGAPGRLGLAIVLSVALAPHLVYWLSLALGYDRTTVFLAAAILALPIPIAAGRGTMRRNGQSAFAGLAGAARASMRALMRDPAPFALATVAAAFVSGVLASGLWHVTADGVDSGGSNWSDLGVHLSIAQSLNAGNFPPQVPYFAGFPLVYHWFADFHAAIAASAAGLFAIPVFVASSGILAASLVLLVHGLARVLLRAPGARRAALIAAAFAVFAGGFGWIKFVGDVTAGIGSPIDLITHNSYDNAWYDALGNVSWPYFRIPSVMATGLLVHRATMAGLPMLVGVVLLLASGLPTRRMREAGWHDRPLLIGLAGLLGALLAPFHFFFFPAALLLALLWVVIGGRLFDSQAPRNALLFLGPYLLSLPFALAALGQASGSGALRWVLFSGGWESAPRSDGPLAVAFFYVTNLGLPLVLAVAALLLRRTPARWFLAAWALALFAIPNLIQASSVGFDMSKYFQAMAIALAILCGWVMRRWRWWALLPAFALAIPSPLLVSGWTAFSRQQVLSADEVAAERWIAANTPGTAIFATDGWLNAPTDAAGRLRLLTFTPYVANLGYDPDLRAAQVDDIYCGGDPARSLSLLHQLGAGYLIDDGRPQPCRAPVTFTGAAGFVPVYANRSLRIFRVGSVSSGP